MSRTKFGGFLVALVLMASTLAPATAMAGAADRFKAVQAWDVTFEIRYDLDASGTPYKHFSGTKSVQGRLRWEEPFEDYGITWSGVGQATVTTTEGTEEIEIEESYLSIVPDENMYSAKFGDASVKVTIGPSSSMTMRMLGELFTPEMPLPADGNILTHDGAVEEDGIVIHLKYSITPAQ